MELRDHHHELILEHFHPSQKKPHVHVQPLPILSPSHWQPFVWTHLPSPEIS